MQQYLEAQQQNAFQNQMQEMQMQQQQVEEMKLQLKTILSQILTKDAMQRLFTLRATRPELSIQAELMLLELYKQGRLKPPVTDQQLKQILTQATQKKKETTIKRR